MLVSIGSQGARKRERGCPWVPVRWRESVDAMSRAGFSGTGIEGAIRVLKAAPFRNPGSRNPRTGVTLTHWHLTAEVLNGDVVRVWGDSYFSVDDDLVHGRVRTALEVLSEREVLVTMWFKPRGRRWMPMFGDMDTTLMEELGWVYDVDE